MKMLDLRQQGNSYYFKLDSGDDFWDTVRLLKNAFRPRERAYNPDTREWSVPATPLNEEKLAMIFSNARDCLTNIKAQMRLF